LKPAIRILALRLLAGAWLAWAPSGHAEDTTFAAGAPAHAPRSLDFGAQTPSAQARRLGDWVALTRDNGGLPFIIVDKREARVFVFDRDGRPKGASRALLGRATGDDTVPGIGARRLATITQQERTTPAGRFVAFLGRDFEHDVLWIDYESGISMHRVIRGDPGDRRLERLATSSAQDKRISYGCINVPVRFYEDVVVPSLINTQIVVYILPEVKSVTEVFGIDDDPKTAARSPSR
jgi:hypothetical protein